MLDYAELVDEVVDEAAEVAEATTDIARTTRATYNAGAAANTDITRTSVQVKRAKRKKRAH